MAEKKTTRDIERKSSKKQLLAIFICSVIFLLTEIGVFLYSRENAFPVEDDFGVVLEASEWARYLLYFFIGSAVFNFVYNIIVREMLIRSVNARKQGNWWFGLVFTVAAAAVLVVVLALQFGEDSACSKIAYVVIILQNLVTFIVSTALTSSIWKKGYFPF